MVKKPKTMKAHGSNPGKVQDDVLKFKINYQCNVFIRTKDCDRTCRLRVVSMKYFYLKYLALSS